MCGRRSTRAAFQETMPVAVARFIGAVLWGNPTVTHSNVVAFLKQNAECGVPADEEGI
jgi:hypothetical protein